MKNAIYQKGLISHIQIHGESSKYHSNFRNVETELVVHQQLNRYILVKINDNVFVSCKNRFYSVNFVRYVKAAYKNCLYYDYLYVPLFYMKIFIFSTYQYSPNKRGEQ